MQTFPSGEKKTRNQPVFRKLNSQKSNTEFFMRLEMFSKISIALKIQAPLSECVEYALFSYIHLTIYIKLYSIYMYTYICGSVVGVGVVVFVILFYIGHNVRAQYNLLLQNHNKTSKNLDKRFVYIYLCRGWVGDPARHAGQYV